MTVRNARTRGRSAGLSQFSKSMTQQQFKRECDINNVIKRYDSTGVLSSVGQLVDKDAIFGDFSNIPDLHSAMTMIAAAEGAFQSLPSWIRKGCKNNPETWINLVMNPDSFDEAERRGYITSEYKRSYDKMVAAAVAAKNKQQKRQEEIAASEQKISDPAEV